METVFIALFRTTPLALLEPFLHHDCMSSCGHLSQAEEVSPRSNGSPVSLRPSRPLPPSTAPYGWQGHRGPQRDSWENQTSSSPAFEHWCGRKGALKLCLSDGAHAWSDLGARECIRSGRTTTLTLVGTHVELNLDMRANTFTFRGKSSRIHQLEFPSI